MPALHPARRELLKEGGVLLLKHADHGGGAKESRRTAFLFSDLFVPARGTLGRHQGYTRGRDLAEWSTYSLQCGGFLNCCLLAVQAEPKRPQSSPWPACPAKAACRLPSTALEGLWRLCGGSDETAAAPRRGVVCAPSVRGVLY